MSSIRLIGRLPATTEICCRCNQLPAIPRPRRLFHSKPSHSNGRSLLQPPIIWKSSQISNYYAKPKGKTNESGKNVWLGLSGVAIGLCTGIIYMVGSPDAENTENDIYKNEPLPLAYLYRFRDRLHEIKESIAEPAHDLLLPDPVPPPYMQPPYTLLIEMTDVLIHAEYDFSTGWRYRKRPGVDQFLKALSGPNFEIVLFTCKDGMTAAPVIDGLDPEGCIMYRLYRDSTKYMDNTHVKDLSRLNRDLRKVILIDWDVNASKLQPRNSFILPKWKGDPKDISLLELIPLFETIAMSRVDDVRPVMDHYRDEPDPVAAFRRRRDELRQQQEASRQLSEPPKSRFNIFGPWRR